MSETLSALFEAIAWGAVHARFEQMDTPPDDALISNVSVVPFVGDQVVVIRLEDGSCEMPGGTREAGETCWQTAQRELVEEAGARLLSYTPFGAWRCHSTSPQPYKAHLPHPDFFRLAGYGAVELVSQPTNPPDGEKVVAVELLTLEAAAQRFCAAGRPDLADLYRLAAHIREAQQ